MPRLPPVSSIVRRGPLWAEVTMGSFYRSGVKPRLRPGLTRRVAAKFDTVVQAERTVMPELEPERGDAPAAPARWARHLADQVLRGNLGDRLFEGEAALQGLRLFRGPGADLGL